MTPIETVTAFFQAFQRRDHGGMAACYAPDARFEDEVFHLSGPDIHAMWHMLCERGADLDVSYEVGPMEGDTLHASWDARYTFSATGRLVHNEIRSTFVMENGKIKTHRDRFDLWRWSRQALGFRGALLGWTDFLKSKIRSSARTSLDKFIAKHAQYAR